MEGEVNNGCCWESAEWCICWLTLRTPLSGKATALSGSKCNWCCCTWDTPLATPALHAAELLRLKCSALCPPFCVWWWCCFCLFRNDWWCCCCWFLCSLWCEWWWLDVDGVWVKQVTWPSVKFSAGPCGTMYDPVALLLTWWLWWCPPVSVVLWLRVESSDNGGESDVVCLLVFDLSKY